MPFFMFFFLEEITREPHAKMQWVHYFQNVVTQYLVVVEGWPTEIPSMNLSDVSSALPQLKALLHNWESGSIFWHKLTEQEHHEMVRKRNEQLDSGEIVEHSWQTRSDKGKKHQKQVGQAWKEKHTAYKSSEIIEDSDGEQDDVHSEKVAASGSTNAVSGPTSSQDIDMAFSNLTNFDYDTLLQNLDDFPLFSK